VRENLETFLAELRAEDRDLPRHVEREFREYLKCGQVGEGFARCVCQDCGDEFLVAFSCKRHGFCPPCLARRMSDTAAHLVDRVLPLVPYRQYVLAYPRRLRLAFARDRKAATESGTIFLREVFRWQRREARARGTKRPLTGAVSVTQRYGSTANLNIHHHALLPDGVFTVGASRDAGFVDLPGPRREDLERILERVVAKTRAMAEARGLLEELPFDGIDHLRAEAVQTGLPLSMEEPREKLAAFREGFSLEAGAHVSAVDRKGLEHLLRYMLRPPFSLKRVHKLPDGRVLLELKKPRHDGVRAVAFTPRQFLRRLAALVPPPRWHATRYFGVFAPASKARPQIVSGAERGGMPEVPEFIDDDGCEDARLARESREEVDGLALPFERPPMPERTPRLPWADLLARVFAVDVLVCAKCGGRRKVTAFMPGGELAREILERLGIDATGPPLAPARAPPHQQEAFELPPGDPGVDAQYPDSP